MSAQSTSLLMGWVGMEISVISFFPLIIKQLKPHSSTLGGVHYFLIQAFGSSLFIVGLSLEGVTFFNFAGIIMLLSLMIKVGLTPCAGWVPRALQGLSWGGVFLASTLQKVGPVMFMSKIPQFDNPSMQYIIFSVCVSSMLQGALMGLNTMKIREFFGWSSVIQSGWMVMLSQLNQEYLFIYIIIYSAISFGVCSVLRSAAVYSFKDLTKSPNLNNTIRAAISLGFLSLAGLPPLSGFSIKWAALQALVSSGWYNLALLILVASAFTLMMYVKLCIAVYSHHWAVLVSSPPIKVNEMSRWSMTTSILVFTSLTPFVFLIIT
nr:NADH dehydrogenase subunit 2 [Glottidia pyramidata]